MYLVYKEDIAGAEIREGADEVSRLLEGRPRGRPDVDAELPRDQLGERRLAEPGGAEEKGVVERLPPGERGIYIDAERFLDPVLTDELREPLRPQRQLDD